MPFNEEYIINWFEKEQKIRVKDKPTISAKVVCSSIKKTPTTDGKYLPVCTAFIEIEMPNGKFEKITARALPAPRFSNPENALKFIEKIFEKTYEQAQRVYEGDREPYQFIEEAHIISHNPLDDRNPLNLDERIEWGYRDEKGNYVLSNV